LGLFENYRYFSKLSSPKHYNNRFEDVDFDVEGGKMQGTGNSGK